MAEPVTETRRSSLITPDWSQLPEDLLHVISNKLNNCFDVVHARSVCSSWRSSFPFPSSLLRSSYSLPAFSDYPSVSKDLCTLEKLPLFLFRLKTPPAPAAALAAEYFLGGIGRDKSEDHLELPSPLQCSVKVKIPILDPTLIKMLDCQILPLGHHYRIIGWECEPNYSGVAFLPLNEGREFAVLIDFTEVLLVLRSDEMRWMPLKIFSETTWWGLVAFRGRFYTVFLNGEILVVDPYSLIQTPLVPSPPLRSTKYLVRSGDDELFLVENFDPFPEAGFLDFNRFACRLSRLDEEASKWVMVSDLGDRVFFIGHFGNVCCSATELPSGCGVSANSILFTDFGKVTYVYKYGVHTGRVEDDLNYWRVARENLVTNLSMSLEVVSPVVALQVERERS